MKKVLSIFVSVLLAAAVCTGCAGQPQTGGTSETQAASSQLPALAENDHLFSYDTLEYEEAVQAEADFVKDYSELSALQADADAAIEGKIIETFNFIHETSSGAVPYTIYRVEVSDCYQGALAPGTVINLAQTGGVVSKKNAGFTKKSDSTAADENALVFYSFGAPLSIKGDTILAFIHDAAEDGVLDFPQPYYSLVGDYHGKLKKSSSDTFAQQLPETEQRATQPLQVKANQKMLLES